MAKRYRPHSTTSKQSRAQDRKPASRVGYGRPPLHGRFVPGQSGNPNGRPRGLLNLKTDLTRELNSRITIRVGNRSVRVKKGKAWIMKVVNGALSNDAKATATLLQLILRFDLLGQTQPAGEAPLTSNDQKLLADWLQRHLDDLDSTRRSGATQSETPETQLD